MSFAVAHYEVLSVSKYIAMEGGINHRFDFIYSPRFLPPKGK